MFRGIQSKAPFPLRFIKENKKCNRDNSRCLSLRDLTVYHCAIAFVQKIDCKNKKRLAMVFSLYLTPLISLSFASLVSHLLSSSSSSPPSPFFLALTSFSRIPTSRDSHIRTRNTTMEINPAFTFNHDRSIMYATLIVGAGLGDLTLGMLLHKANIPYEIYELLFYDCH